MMETVNIQIDGIKAQVPKNYTVLEAAKSLNINIPTLYFLKGLNEVGACRICVVEVQGARTLQASCVLPVSEGMIVRSSSPTRVGLGEEFGMAAGTNVEGKMITALDRLGFDNVYKKEQGIVYYER